LKSAFICAHKSFLTLQRLASRSEADLSANLCGGDPGDGGYYEDMYVQVSEHPLGILLDCENKTLRFSMEKFIHGKEA